MLHKTLTTLSLVGLLFSLGLWGASYFWFQVYWGGSRVSLVAGTLSWDPTGLPSDTPPSWRCDGFWGFDLKRLAPRHKYWGFRPAFPHGQGGSQSGLPNVALPGIRISWLLVTEANGVAGRRYLWTILLWAPTLVFGIILCLCRPVYYRRRRKRKKLGLCVECGYNLRGLTEPRCPECNTRFEKCSARP